MFRRRRVEKALRALDHYYLDFLVDSGFPDGPFAKSAFYQAALREAASHRGEAGLDPKTHQLMIDRLQEMFNAEYAKLMAAKTY